MGMFDHITLKAPCGSCGKEIDGFQSKDSNCVLDHLNFWEVDNFYTNCNSCGSWNSYSRKDKRQPLPLTAYELHITPPYTVTEDNQR